MKYISIFSVVVLGFVLFLAKTDAADTVPGISNVAQATKHTCWQWGLCNENQKTTAFKRDCKSVSPLFPRFDAFCEQVAKETYPANLEPYSQLVNKLRQDIQRLGPDIAKKTILDCVSTSLSAKPDPKKLMFCMSFKGLRLEDLSQGKGTAEDYLKVIEKSEISPVYPTESTPGAESQRAEVRKALIYGCVEQGEGYLKTVCSAVAIHEVFASRPFGDSGELAKAFDGVVKVYAVASLPQSLAKQTLHNIGVPDNVIAVLDTPNKVTSEVTKEAVKAVQTVNNGVEHAKSELNKQIQSLPFKF